MVIERLRPAGAKAVVVRGIINAPKIIESRVNSVVVFIVLICFASFSKCRLLHRNKKIVSLGNIPRSVLQLLLNRPSKQRIGNTALFRLLFLLSQSSNMMKGEKCERKGTRHTVVVIENHMNWGMNPFK